tara:strand:+ start:451 stop:759 length:309 start_codon:yes stop_codon:yes gene_type:complete
MEKSRKNILLTTIIISALILVTYGFMYFYQGKEIEKFKDNAITLLITSFAFIISSIALTALALEKEEGIKELKEYGPYLALGCFISIIYSAYDIFIMFYNLF